MRAFLFILLAILIASCSTTKEYDCDYSDYKTISLEDFEWVTEIDEKAFIEIKEDSVFVSLAHIGHPLDIYENKIIEIDIINGNIIDTIISKDPSDQYYQKYPSDEVPCGMKYFIKPPRGSCVYQLNLLFNTSKIFDSHFKKQNIILEINGFYKNGSRKYGEFKYRINKDGLWGITDMALYKGCYLILAIEVHSGRNEGFKYRIAMLDLQKLIDNY